MNIGKLNRRIKLYTVTRVADTIGGYTETEVLQKETWASVIPLSQREILLYGMEVGVRGYKIGIRLDLGYDIDQSFSFKYTNRFSVEKTLRIVSILDIGESGNEFIILANERTD